MENKKDGNKKFSQYNFFSKNRRGQLDLSFGMIFSIILIIIFLAFAFYAITKFLDLQKEIQIKQFVTDLQSDVDKMWKSPQGSQQVTYSLPTKISAICFFNNNQFQNLNFTSSEIIKGEEINNIDISKITKNGSPFCITNAKGKIKMVLTKSYGESLVTITK
jgi:hypothetical protein